MMSIQSVVEPTLAWLLFTVEWYHIWAHALILFRIRMLPRKDLVRLRLYFLVDLLTVLCSSLFTGKLYWLAVLQIMQHFYYVLFWDKTDFAKRIINWSSLDYLQSELRDRWELDSILGTMFDMIVHLSFAYYLGTYLTTVMSMTSLVLVLASIINWSSLDYLQSELRDRWELDSILGTMFDMIVHLSFAYYLGTYLTTVMAMTSLVLVQASVILLLFGPHFAWSCPRNIPKWVEKRIHPEEINKQHSKGKGKRH